ncbi:histamine N-methyltransferase-like [Asterias amurensis]|uniref:histamine N-methyltransferase-like n=1 Tax=Asterias amurensis TaxID=7602 RepID=UPI003AB5B242
MSSAAKSTEDIKFESNSEHYAATIDAYGRASNRRDVLMDFVRNELPVLGQPATGNNAQNHGALKVLSVGVGDGDIDINILIKLRQREQRHIQAVIVEPDPKLMGRYKSRTEEPEKVQGIDFEWRQETLEEFQKSPTGQKDDKFHFINFFNTVYYLEDKEKSLRYLYDKLDVGGVLVITVMSGEGGFARFWRYHGQHHDLDPLCDSDDVMKYLENQRIPVSETLDKKCYLNITSCFARPLQELSGDGNLLLDFLTHTLGFTKKSTVEYQDGVMKLLGSDYCSTRDASGQVLLKADNVVFVIRRTNDQIM